MNRLEANVSLLIITLFSAVHFAFLGGDSESISSFGYLAITNLIGFLIGVAFCYTEFYRIDMRQIKQCLIISLELIIYNVALLAGIAGLGASVVSMVDAVYFIFIVLIIAVVFKQLPDRDQISGIILIIAGTIMMTDIDLFALWNKHVIFVIISDLAFASYIVSIWHYSKNSNPAVLALGQMFFCFIGGLILWTIEANFFGGSFKVPTTRHFWQSVLYTSFFIRALYGFVQVYAQRYVSPLNVVMIFSSELVMTLFLAPFLANRFGVEADEITFVKVVGSIVLIFGLLMIEPEFIKLVRRIRNVRN